MVDFVLDQLGAIALELFFVPNAFDILVSYANPICPLDPHEEVGERKTVIPDPEILGSDVDDLGIDEGPRLLHLDVNHADRSTNLWSCNCPTTSEARLPVAQGLTQIVEYDSHGRRPWSCDRLAAGAKDGIAEEPDAMDRHEASVLAGSHPAAKRSAQYTGGALIGQTSL